MYYLSKAITFSKRFDFVLFCNSWLLWLTLLTLPKRKRKLRTIEILKKELTSKSAVFSYCMWWNYDYIIQSLLNFINFFDLIELFSKNMWAFLRFLYFNTVKDQLLSADFSWSEQWKYYHIFLTQILCWRNNFIL